MNPRTLITLSALVIGSYVAAQTTDRKAELDSLAHEIAQSGILTEETSNRIDTTDYILRKRAKLNGEKINGFFDGKDITVHMPKTTTFEEQIMANYDGETTLVHEEAHKHYQTLDKETQNMFHTLTTQLMQAYHSGATLTKREKLMAETLESKEEFYQEWYGEHFEHLFYGTEAYAIMAGMEYRVDGPTKIMNKESVLYKMEKRMHQEAIETYINIPACFQPFYENFFVAPPEEQQLDLPLDNSTQIL